MNLNEVLKSINITLPNKNQIISGINSLIMAGENDISFFSSDTPKYRKELSQSRAIAILVNEKNKNLLPKNAIAIIDNNPYLKMAELSKIFAYKVDNQNNKIYSQGKNCSIHPSVTFGKNVIIKDNVEIMSGCYIGDYTVINENTRLNPNITVYHHSKIGKDCIIHSGTVIGSDGYGYIKNLDNQYVKIYQNGNVIILDNVEIGSNCSIDRATFNSTIINSNVKLDNLIHIGHNCIIGANSMIMADATLAGSITVGKNVVIGGSSVIAGFLNIEDNVIITGHSIVTKNLLKNRRYSGMPVEEHTIWLKNQSKIKRMIKKYFSK